MKLSHIFKVILFLLLPFFVLAQYPNNPIKSRLGWQTTGDGLVYRGSGAPAYSPGTIFNAWMYLDTVTMALYGYKNFQWVRVPNVNNGLSISSDGYRFQLGGSLIQNTTVESGTYSLILGKTTGTNYAHMQVYGSGEGVGLFNSYQSGDYEAEINAQGGIAAMLVENFIDGGGSYLSVEKDGFAFSYLHPVLGVSQFGMDSTRFYIRGLPTYATHAAADADIDSYGMYQITDGRAIYARTGTADKVSPNIQDNGTAVSILNSKPFQLGQWTTAGRPAGTTGYEGYNTTGNGKEWYQGSRWAYALESTFARGTATRVLFSDANGQITDDAGIRFESASKTLAINRPTIAASPYHLEIQSTGTVNQRWISVYNSSGTQQASYDSDGSGNGAVLVYNSLGVIQGRFSSGDASYLTGKMAFGAQIPGTADFLVALRQTDVGLNVRANIGSSGNGYPGIGYNVQFTSSNNSYTRKSNDQCYFLDMGTNGRFSMKSAASGSTGSSITWNEDFSLVQSSRFIGIGQTNPQRKLDVNGEVRIADLTTDTPTRFVGADADGDLGAISFSSIWRDYQTDKALLGSDSSFVHDPSVDTTRILGSMALGKPSTLGSPTTSGYQFTFRNPNNASTYMLIESGRIPATGGGAGMRLLPSGQFGGEISFGTTMSSDLSFYSFFAGKSLFNVGLSNFVTGNKNTVLVGGIQDPIQWDFNARFVVYDTITSGKALAVFKKVASSSTPIAMFSSSSNDRFTFNDDGTTRFHVYGTPATTAPALSKTLTNYGVGFATDGTVTSREIKRDTAIYVTDADYNFAAAITSAQILARHNRIIIYSKLSSGATSDNQIILHSASSDFLQCEIIIYSNDASADADATSIDFTTNGAVDGAGGTVSSYGMSPGQRVNIRATNDGGYKWFFN